jgi:UrcA family protein
MSISLAPGSMIVGALLAISPLCSDALGAQPPQSQEHERVKFNFQFKRTDLANDKEASRVFKALVSKARKACTAWGESSISLHRTDTECVAQLVERVSTQMGAEKLAQQCLNPGSGPPPGCNLRVITTLSNPGNQPTVQR